ncbi:hypothetical protein AWC22_18280 [Mycobacterium riyadhense]|uniref:Uncharacterized protein n=2 Tax=Mycobacterium riyadhense TaxID=486698 RepID=A0A1X2CW55_9MYCO|nr:hypothetical protein AWC22_18280 [Mycobacterium riyadhense]
MREPSPPADQAAPQEAQDHLAGEAMPAVDTELTGPAKKSAGRITGAVADIEDRYTLIINKGEKAGVKPGMIFAVVGAAGKHVIDPITGEDLGARPGVKLRVKVTEVFEKFARAETYVIVPPFQSFGLGGVASSTMQDLIDARELSLLGGGRQRMAGYGRRREEEEPPAEAVVPVRIGDEVKQVG